jgi:hypothetical protein
LAWLVRETLHLPVRARMAMDPERPWLAASAIRFLDAHLTSQMRGFEWGSGASTLFLARRTAFVRSIEHKAKWHRRITARLTETGLTNVRLDLVPPEMSPPSSRRPHIWRERNLIMNKPDFNAYADAILDEPDASFDYIMIDGRARIACAANAMHKLAPGGLLVLDNSERRKYRPIFDMLENWPVTLHANGVWQTAIFTKPAEAV